MKMTAQQPEDQMASRASWFALGMLSGAAVALLASPWNGRENRQMISRRARQVAGTISEEGRPFIDAQKQRIADAVDRGRTEVQAFGSRVNEAVEQGRTTYRNAKDRFQSAAAEVSDEARQKIEEAAGPRSMS